MTSAGEGNRPRAPTITLDTSAIKVDNSEKGEELNSAHKSPTDPNTLTVPARPRVDSVDSQSSAGSNTSSTTPVPAGNESSNKINLTSDVDLWKPEDESEAPWFQDENSPFGVTRGHLSKLIPRKNLAAFYHLRGLSGIALGLRTDIKNGLPSDEQHLDGTIAFDKVKSAGPVDQSEVSTSAGKPSELEEAPEKPPSGNAFADRKRIFGDNRLPDKKSKSIFVLAWEALQDKVLIVLCVAAVISLALGIYQSVSGQSHEGGDLEWIEGVAIIVAIVIVVSVGALNDWSKERQFAKLNRKKDDRLVKVTRSGVTQKVSVYDVFPGDVMVLEQGDVLPVDGIYIEGHNVSCDESSATGESDLMKKSPAAVVYKALEAGQDTRKLDPFILSGAKVSEGFGTFLVTAVGVNSSHGRTMLSLREDTEATPLQFKLNRLAGYIAKLGSGAGILLFTVLLIEFLAHLKRPNGEGFPRTSDDKASEFIQILIVSVTIIVVAVPEGLPLAVTLALAFATRKMTKDNNLVRHLQSCETMGNATVICSDKTGTLTQNVMTVVAGTFGRGDVRAGDKEKLDAAEKEISTGSPTSTSSVPAGESTHLPIYDIHERLNKDLQVVLKDSFSLNSTAFEGEENGKKAFIGSKTETALLDFAARCFGLANLAKERELAETVQLIPFDSRKKCMGVIVKKDKGYRLFIKGASEIVLAHCTETLENPLKSTETTKLTETDQDVLKAIISSYAQRSLRTIGVAFRDFTEWPPAGLRTTEEDPNMVEFEDLFKHLTWLSVVGIQDPVRNGVPEAVKTCERAGVRVLMVTGDNVETARAIAKECGILKEDGIVLEGAAFRALSSLEVDNLLPKLCVLARSSPEDKRTLVRAFRGEAHVVAVTGDGTNDAPALKAADVGFSMGITGTEVAKEASDIILMDDNFSSIVKALAWGRTINDAVKKFLQFQITVNIVAVLLTFITAVGTDSSVLNAVQLLWVNLIMDTFAALALATDPPAASVFDRKPEPRNSPLISVTMWKMIMGQTIFQLIVTMVMFWKGQEFIAYDSERQFKALIFNVFVWMQIFSSLNSRRIDNRYNIFEGFIKNPWFFGILLIMIGGQTLIMFVGDSAFKIKRITGPQWGISIVIGLLSLPVGLLIRFVPDDWVRIDIPAKKAFKAIVPKSWQRKWEERKLKKSIAEQEANQGAPNGEHFSKEWSRVYVKVNDDLTLYKRLRGRRLAVIKESIRHPRETIARSRSGSRHSVLPALIAPGAMAGGIGGSITPSDGRSVGSRSAGDAPTPVRQNTPPKSDAELV